MKDPPVELSSAAELIRAVARGSEPALKRLYEREAGRLYAVAVRIVRRRDVADEVLQDSFVQIWQNARRFEEDRGAAEAWLTGIVRYRAIDAARSVAREDITGDPSLGDDVEFCDPADLIDLKAIAPQLYRCIDLLDDGPKRCVLLAYVDGLAHGEIAARIRSPLGTVKSWIRRALISLRSCLDP